MGQPHRVSQPGHHASDHEHGHLGGHDHDHGHEHDHRSGWLPGWLRHAVLHGLPRLTAALVHAGPPPDAGDHHAILASHR